MSHRLILQPAASYQRCIHVISKNNNSPFIMQLLFFSVADFVGCGDWGGKKTIKEKQARWSRRRRSRLSSLQNAADSLAAGASDIYRATGLRNTPELTEKNAINTFLLFSPSLSPDLFMFLELCLHCLVVASGDHGCCSSAIKTTAAVLPFTTLL